MKRIAVIGDFNQNEESHYLIMESIKNVAEEMQGEIEAQWIMSDALDVSEEYLKRFDGFWFSPGSPYKNAENVLAAIQYARENGVPALGTCAGFQYMVIEFARNVLGLDSADSEENGAKREDAVIARLACTLMNQKEQLEMTNPDSPLARMAGGDRFIGEYRCNYGFNEAFCGVFQNSDMITAVVETKNRYLRGFELKEHPFFVGTLFIPQLDFRGNNSYRIIKAYIKAVLSVTDFTTITACGECCVGCSKKIEGSCPGCIEADGRVPEWAESGRCKVHACAREHGVQFCGLCKEFPCEKLPAIISWNADIIDHLTALRNEYMQR